MRLDDEFLNLDLSAGVLFWHIITWIIVNIFYLSSFLTYDTISPLFNVKRNLLIFINIQDRDVFLPRCMECRRGPPMRILSVRPSVCPSVTRVYCDKTVEISVQIFIPYETTFSLVFWEKEWLVGGGGDPFYLKFRVNRPPLERNRRFSTNNRS